jgi:hypothetical protein
VSGNPTRRANGSDMLTVRITRNLHRSEVIDLLAHRHVVYGLGEGRPSKTRVLDWLRQSLHEEGYDPWWQERYPDDVDDAVERATELVDTLWPGWYEAPSD